MVVTSCFDCIVLVQVEVEVRVRFTRLWKCAGKVGRRNSARLGFAEWMPNLAIGGAPFCLTELCKSSFCKLDFEVIN